MDPVLKDVGGIKARTNEGFNLGMAIAVLLILLLFVAASFYILISSYLEIN